LKQNKEILLISVLLLTTLAHVFDFVIMMPLGPKLMNEFSISAAYFGNLVSIYTIAAAISSFFSALWVDRFNRKFSLIGLLVGFSAGNLLCIGAPTVEVLLAGRAIAGMFGGVMQAIVYSIISDFVSHDRQGKAAGFMGMAFPIVSIVGVPIGLKVADYWGWHSSFIMVLLMSVIAIVMALATLPSMEPKHVKEEALDLWSPIKKVWSHKPHRVGILLMFLTVMGGFTIVPYIAPFLVNNGYLLENQLYLIYLIGGAFSIVSSRVIGGLTDKYGKTKVMRIMLILVILAIGFFTNLPKHSLALVLIATTITMVVMPGRFVCVMSWFTSIAHPQTRGAFLSLVSTTQQVSLGIATVVGGALVGESADGTFETFWLVGLAAITANVLVLLLVPRMARIEQEVLDRNRAV